MEKILTKLDSFINKIGKQNVILIVFILIIFCVTALYQTFSIYTTSNGVSIINGIKTYSFILSNSGENSVVIPANSSKKIAITISNTEKISLKYGLYYSSTNDLTNVNIGYLSTTEHFPNGNIDPETNYSVMIQIDNNSSSNVTIQFGVKYGVLNGGDLIKDNNQYWIDLKEMYLNSVEPGSYVYYIGNNGCSGATCVGRNINYVNDNNMGYCYSANKKFSLSGWRVAYVEGNNAYLISASAPECLCTNYDGSAGGSNGATCANYEQTSGLPKHMTNLQNVALKYCNSNYIDGGTCNSSNTWAMNMNDFTAITGGSFVDTSGNNICYNENTNPICGYNNNLIDNGGYYWFNQLIATNGTSDYHWSPNTAGGIISSYNPQTAMGVRPVLKLKSDLKIVGGQGTYKNPYRVTTDSLKITDLSGRGNHGINYGASINKSNGTVTTNGSSNYVDAGLTNYKFGNDVSFVVRVGMQGTINSGDTWLIGNWESAGGGLSLLNGKVVFALRINDSYAACISDATVASIIVNTIVGTYDGTSLKVYMNGVPATCNNTATPPSWATNQSTISGDVVASSVPIWIGNNPSPDAQVYSGGANAIFYDVLIFDRALTAEEIASDYQSEVNPTNTNDLLLYYNFK